MMTKTTTARKKTLLQAMILPVMALTAGLLCHKVIAQENTLSSIPPEKIQKIDVNRRVTQHQADSLRKADPRVFTSKDPKDYGEITTTYTDDKGKTVAKKTFMQSEAVKIPTNQENPLAGIPAEKIERIDVDRRITQQVADSLRKADPKRFTSSDPTDYSALKVKYTDEKNKIVVKKIFIQADPSAPVDPSAPPVAKSLHAAVNMPVPATAPLKPLNADEAQEDKVYSAGDVTVQPEFPGGLGGFFSTVNKEFKVPKLKEPVAAKIYVSFVVETDGSMSNIKVLKDPGNGLGDEAVRTLKAIKTKWNPGKVGTKPVRTSYNLPITINTTK